MKKCIRCGILKHHSSFDKVLGKEFKDGFKMWFVSKEYCRACETYNNAKGVSYVNDKEISSVKGTEGEARKGFNYL